MNETFTDLISSLSIAPIIDTDSVGTTPPLYQRAGIRALMQKFEDIGLDSSSVIIRTWASVCEVTIRSDYEEFLVVLSNRVLAHSSYDLNAQDKMEELDNALATACQDGSNTYWGLSTIRSRILDGTHGL